MTAVALAACLVAVVSAGVAAACTVRTARLERSAQWARRRTDAAALTANTHADTANHHANEAARHRFAAGRAARRATGHGRSSGSDEHDDRAHRDAATPEDRLAHYRRGCRAPECTAAHRDRLARWRSGSRLGEGDVDAGVQSDVDEAIGGLEGGPALGADAVPGAPGVVGERRVDVIPGVVEVVIDEFEGRSGDVQQDGHEMSSRFGRTPGATGPVGGALGVGAPGAGDPTVEATADSDGGPSAPFPSVADPVEGGEATAPPSTAAPGHPAACRCPRHRDEQRAAMAALIPPDAVASFICPRGDGMAYLLPDSDDDEHQAFTDLQDRHAGAGHLRSES